MNDELLGICQTLCGRQRHVVLTFSIFGEADRTAGHRIDTCCFASLLRSCPRPACFTRMPLRRDRPHDESPARVPTSCTEKAGGRDKVFYNQLKRSERFVAYVCVRERTGVCVACLRSSTLGRPQVRQIE